MSFPNFNIFEDHYVKSIFTKSLQIVCLSDVTASSKLDAFTVHRTKNIYFFYTNKLNPIEPHSLFAEQHIIKSIIHINTFFWLFFANLSLNQIYHILNRV